MLFPTTLVGSYPQPDWLIDHAQLLERVPPRVRATEFWRVPAAYLKEAQEDATLVAIRAQEEIGIDIVTDGEIRRESYSNRFATALEGIDQDNPVSVVGRSGRPNFLPQIVGPIRRTHISPCPGRSPCCSRRRTCTTPRKKRRRWITRWP